jgi:hypothetical protein
VLLLALMLFYRRTAAANQQIQAYNGKELD